MNAKKVYVIDQLRKSGVRANLTGTPIESLDYLELKYLLAIRKAVVQ